MNKGIERWYVDVSGNVLPTPTYGSFPNKAEAVHFSENAEFGLRKLLDFELRSKSKWLQDGPFPTPRRLHNLFTTT